MQPPFSGKAKYKLASRINKLCTSTEFSTANLRTVFSAALASALPVFRARPSLHEAAVILFEQELHIGQE
jgi:hypothetical protein